MRTKTVSLSIAENFKLCNLILAEYTERAVSDEMFARYASGKFGFEVNANHVLTRRKEFGIAGTRDVLIQQRKELKAAKMPKTAKSVEAFEALLSRVNTLERQVQHLMSELGVNV